MKIKVCGLRDLGNIKEVIALGVDFIGLNFYKPSPRFVDIEKVDVPAIRQLKVKKVGVFVNESIDTIRIYTRLFGLDYVQLHGNENEAYIKSCLNFCKVIQVIGVEREEDLNVKVLEGVDYLLFDKKSPLFGGTGQQFDWKWLSSYKGNVPFFLAGGIGPEHVMQIAMLNHNLLEGLDLNSKFELNPAEKDHDLLKSFLNKVNQVVKMSEINTQAMKSQKSLKSPDEMGYYGEFGGAYIPEMLHANVEELRLIYQEAIDDPAFQAEYKSLLRDYVGRPSPLYLAKRLSERYGTNVWLKREDLNHTGAHKINNTVGQILIAKRLGKKRIIAETGAGQHGVATATVCALMGLECFVYMGAVDIERQAPNVARMRMLGATVIPAESGSKTLKDATNEAIRDWINNAETTHYIIGSAIGPHPYPDMVTQLQAIVSEEISYQLKEHTGKDHPDYVVACVGGGSNAAGAFYHFLDDERVQLILAEAAGKGIDSGHSAATSILGSKGIIHGCKTLLMQDKDGQIIEPYSLSAGLDYPGIGPLHAHLITIGRAKVYAATDDEAMQAVFELSKIEGIIPALETAHALAILSRIGAGKDDHVVVSLSGRGDKDLNTYMNYDSIKDQVH